MGTPQRFADTPPMAQYENIREYDASLNGSGLAIAVVMSRFNQDIGEGLLSACTSELRRLGVGEGEITIATVPGALEIPLTLQTMASSGRFAALIALGAVIRGETYHFEIVAGESARGIMALTMDGVAIGNGILTVENEQQALVRADPAQKNKGGEAAQAALALHALRNRYA